MSGENSAFDLLHKNIQQWIYKNGWEELRPAQVESIKEIRQTSNHLINCCPTASVKTEDAMLHQISELLEKNIMTVTSSDPNIVRLLPPFILNKSHVDNLSLALKEINNE